MHSNSEASVIYTIGISGVTNSGKTTVCNRMQDRISNCHIIYMDDYFKISNQDEIEWVEKVKHRNWEDLSAVNFEQLMRDYNALKKQLSFKAGKHFIFLDGILIFNYKPLNPYISKKFFLTLDKEECRRRRSTRNYDPPDVPGYFDIVVWPMYEKNLAEIQDQSDIVYLDGRNTSEELFQKVFDEISLL